MVTGFLGGRLFHVFFEQWDYYAKDLSLILHFWDGGFVFFGGAILSASAAWIFLFFTDKKHTLDYFDLFAPIMALAYGLGRIGCLMAGCCYGKACDLPWAINHRHPTQLYATLWELAAMLILLGIAGIDRKNRKPAVFQKPGAVFFLWMIFHGFGRLLMETFRDDFRGPVWGITISSWISVALIALGVFLLIVEPQEKES
jgi:Prolipoprotein diacylglyceryltransferase